LHNPVVGASTKEDPLAEPQADGILVAEQLEAVPPLTPLQDQAKVFVEGVTSEATPALQRFAEGVLAEEVPLAEPQTPFSFRGAKQETSSVVKEELDPLHFQL